MLGNIDNIGCVRNWTRVLPSALNAFRSSSIPFLV